MVPAQSAGELARAAADGFEAAGVPYAIGGAIGGAIAYGIWALPRATQDVDVTLFLVPSALKPAFNVLKELGAAFSEESAMASALERGDFAVQVGGMRLDLFVPSIPFYSSVQTRIRTVEFRDRPLKVLSPEDLTVFKMLFFRPKVLIDVERLVSLGAGGFDRQYVRQWLVTMVGAEDSRVANCLRFASRTIAGNSWLAHRRQASSSR